MTGTCYYEAKAQKQTIFRQDLFSNIYSASKIMIYNENYKADRNQFGARII